MELLDNPFHTLRATLRNSRAEIMEKAEERTLIEDADACSAARAMLTHPKRRLAAEIAWLPGISPKRIAATIQVLKSDISHATNLDSLPPLARANILCAALPRVIDTLDSSGVVDWILATAAASEEIDAENVLQVINDDRAVSGFAEVRDASAVEEQLLVQWTYYQDAVTSALDKRDSRDLVTIMTEAVDRATSDGTTHAPALLDDIVDRYEVEAHRFLEREAANVQAILDVLRELAKSGGSTVKVNTAVDQLAQVTRNWDKVAQPIQVSKTSRGIDHDMSQHLAAQIRDTAIHLFNEFDMLDVSQRMVELQKEVFAEVLSAAEQAERDATQLADMAEQAQDLKASDEEFRRELLYEAEIGVVFKDKLRISSDGIEWKGSHWPLDTITSTYWGGTRNSVNGIPTGTTYVIKIGNGDRLETISLRNATVFQEFTQRLFRGVGMRLMNDIVQGLAMGSEFRFGNAVVNDTGIVLETRQFFGANPRNHYLWKEISIWNDGGAFCLGRKDDSKTMVVLSYQDDANTHILEGLIRIFWKRSGPRLSQVFKN